ncbi:Alpha/Beta hydrolase protein [Filobasidium floriforme]|uniref:Alpha/Beta hydrolase protein n=1 Tax=Filobasidium floriforme TaxID=5210 RepID=UPI001E8D14FB|nr:Alpha/Beta hydrolase protein [Filobasidium floriforme]KAH8080115.1 Alpha/Beta hydrolase protein [Filobasidium floriforme]
MSDPSKSSSLLGYLTPPTDSLTNNSAPNAWPAHLDRLAVTLIYIILLLVVLPPTVIISVTRYYAFGPMHKDWDLKTQVMSNVMYWFILFLFLFKLPGKDRGEDKVAKTMRRKKMEVEQVVVPPCDQSYVVGWAKHQMVKPMPRPGFMIWPTNKASSGSAEARGTGLERAKKGEKVILYFVGGGFISGHPLLSHLAWTVSELLDTRIFCVNYRKSIQPDAAFPGNLLDALSGYLYLVNELGFEPDKVVVMGDSAGGNTALGLARYLGELQKQQGESGRKEVGMVGGLILFSPWCDMTEQPGTSAEFNKKYDYVSSMGFNAIAAHTRHYPNHLRSPYFSPALPSPDGSPRFSHLTQGQGKTDKGSVNGEQKKGTKVYVQAGTAELLWDQAKMLCRGMREEGVDVTLREVPGDIHVGILFNLAKPLKATREDLPEFWNGLD